MTLVGLGTDLALIPRLAAHDAAEIDLVPRTRVGRVTVLSGAGEPVDLDTLAGRENLAQALLLRLLIPVGSLGQLGHAGYGSRLQALIGQRKTESLRNLCRAYVLEVVQQEPRVEDRAVVLQFEPLAETASTFVFTLAVRPRLGEEPVGISLEIGL